MDKWDPEDYYKHSYPQYAFALGLAGRLGLLGDERFWILVVVMGR